MNDKTEKDTVKLLRECDLGIKMGISALGDTIPKAGDAELENILKESKLEHAALRARTEELLNACMDKGRSPSPAAKAMSSMKTKIKLANGTEQDAAEIIVKGCGMGIDSLKKSVSKYENADGESRELTNRIICAEERLITDLKKYL